MQNINRHYVSFAIYDADLSAAQITKKAGIPPDFAASKGEVREVGRAKIILQNSIWEIKSKLNPEEELEAHLVNLLSLLQDHIEGIRKLTSQYESHIKLAVYFYSANQGILLPPSVLKQVSDLNVTLDFDLYYLG